MISRWLKWAPSNRPAKPSEPTAFELAGHAVEFDRNGESYFLVADKADAQRLLELYGIPRGEIWTVPEVDLVSNIRDQAARDEIARWKRMFDGTLRADSFKRPRMAKLQNLQKRVSDPPAERKESEERP